MDARAGAATIALAAALALALLVAPAATPKPAKWVKYRGDIDPAEKGSAPTAVQFAVKMKEKGGKRVPVAVGGFKSKAVVIHCSDGDFYWDDSQGEGIGFYGFLGYQTPVKNRRFSDTASDDDEYFDEGTGHNYFLEEHSISGRIPRRGAATGTLRLRSRTEVDGAVVRSCDSGVVAWSATKR
jgi:hypothetical protein